MKDPQHALKEWLARKLEPHGVATEVARVTEISGPKLSRSKELESSDPKKRRKIPEYEILALARHFRELPPGYEDRLDWIDWDEAGTPPATPSSRPGGNASFPPRYQAFSDVHTVPLLGQSVTGPNGRFILNGQQIARLFCPPGLEGVEGAYAVRVYGTSMEPRFRAGETVWINPHEPVRAGDDVVVQIATDEEHVYDSYIKSFVSQSGSVLRLRQINPDEGENEMLSFPTGTVFSVHKIVFHAMF